MFWGEPRGTYHTVVPAHSFRRVRWAGHTSRLGGSTSLLFILLPLPLCDYHCCLLRVYMRVWLWGRVETVWVPFQSIKQLMRVADSKINLLKTLVSLHRPNYIYLLSPVVCVWPILYIRSPTQTHIHFHSPSATPSSSFSFFSRLTLFISHFPHCTVVGHGRGISLVGGGCLSS